MKSDTLIGVVIFHSSPHIQLWALAGFTFHSSLFTLHSSLFTLHFSLFTLHSSLFTLHFSFFTLHSSLFTLIGQLSAGGIDVLATGVADGRGDTCFFEFSFIQL